MSSVVLLPVRACRSDQAHMQVVTTFGYFLWLVSLHIILLFKHSLQIYHSLCWVGLSADKLQPVGTCKLHNDQCHFSDFSYGPHQDKIGAETFQLR